MLHGHRTFELGSRRRHERERRLCLVLRRHQSDKLPLVRATPEAPARIRTASRKVAGAYFALGCEAGSCTCERSFLSLPSMEASPMCSSCITPNESMVNVWGMAFIAKSFAMGPPKPPSRYCGQFISFLPM